MPGGINPFIKQWLRYANENILIVNSDLPSIIDGYRFMKLNISEKRNLKFSIIVNKANSINEGQKTYNGLKTTIEKFKVKANIHYMGCIFNDQERVFQSIQKRIPLVLLYKEAPITQSLKQVSLNLKTLQHGRKVQAPYTKFIKDNTQ